MYSYIRGPLAEVELDHIVIDVNGIGYNLYIPTNCFEYLPEPMVPMSGLLSNLPSRKLSVEMCPLKSMSCKVVSVSTEPLTCTLPNAVVSTPCRLVCCSLPSMDPR